MTKNPFYNALFAISYIVTLVSVINFVISSLGDSFHESIFIPMSMLATLVFSVALMGYLFFYQPLLLILEGKREEGVNLFLKTLGIFAVGTILVMFTAYIVGVLGLPAPAFN